MNKKLYITALSALVIASCAKEAPVQESVNPVIEEQPVAPVRDAGFTARMPGSKTAVTALGDTLLVTWTTDDPIFLSTGASSTRLYVKEGGYTAAQLVTKTTMVSGERYYSVFPDTLGVGYSTSDQLYTLMIPAVQEFVGGSFDAKSYPMLATCDDQVHNLSFRNVAALLQVDATTAKMSGAKVTKIIVSATNQIMGGYFKYSYDGVNDPELNTRVSGSNSVVLNVNDQPLGTRFYIPVAPGDYENLKITVVLDSEVQSVYTVGTKTLERSKYYAYSFNFEEYDGYTDLGAVETANTYVIKAPGKYKFSAMVKGNGAITSKSGAASISGATSVAEAWADGTKFIDGYKFAGGYIYFDTVTGTLPIGTSIVTVRAFDNSTIWSWLIWANKNVKDIKLNDTAGTWMNMNLGAHQESFNAKGYNGYYYQWGRKDPLQQALNLNAAGTSESFGPKPWVSKASTTEGSLDKSILNPTYFYGGYYYKTGTPKIEDWENYDDNRKVYDWWCQGLYEDYDPSSSETIVVKKTMFDPCPAGYHVPSYGEFNTLQSEKTAGNLTFSYEGTEADKNVTVKCSNGKETLCFPAASARSAGVDLKMFGVAGYYATVNSSTTDTKDNRKVHRFWFRGGGLGANTIMRAAGQTVRCIKGE